TVIGDLLGRGHLREINLALAGDFGRVLVLARTRALGGGRRTVTGALLPASASTGRRFILRSLFFILHCSLFLPHSWGGAHHHTVATVIHDAGLHLHVVLQPSLWLDAETLQDAVVGFHCFFGSNLAVGDQ